MSQQRYSRWVLGLLVVAAAVIMVLVGLPLQDEWDNKLQSFETTFSLLNSETDAVVILDEHGRIRGMSPAAERLARCKYSEVTGYGIAFMVPPEFRELHRSFFDAAMERGALSNGAGVQEIICELLRGDATRVDVRLHTRLVVNSEGERFAIAFIDPLDDIRSIDTSGKGREATYR